MRDTSLARCKTYSLTIFRTERARTASTSRCRFGETGFELGSIRSSDFEVYASIAARARFWSLSTLELAGSIFLVLGGRVSLVGLVQFPPAEILRCAPDPISVCAPYCRSASLEQIVESWERFAASVLLKLNHPRPNRCRPSVWVHGYFALGLNVGAFTFLVLDQFDCWLGVHLFFLA